MISLPCGGRRGKGRIQRSDRMEEPTAANNPGHLLDAAGVLFHGDLLRRALKAKEGLHVQACCLFKAGPVLILWMNLQVQRDGSRTSG